MSLQTYNEKRNFRRTVEPKGARHTNHGHSYLIQKHDASHLHYDFRLEMDGVLKSWAIPKGPSLNPKDKRLAVQTEDHPLDYGSFEGVIPPDSYGAGTVMLWDKGEWEAQPDESASQALNSGKLSFVLHGERLQGRWSLVKMKPRKGGGKGGAKQQWLLIKEEDDYASTGKNATEVFIDSVVSHRSMKAIAEDRRLSSRNGNGNGKTKERASSDGGRQREKSAEGNSKDNSKGNAKGNPKDNKSETHQLAGVNLTSPDKILYDKMGITKQDLAEYYVEMEACILPYVADRPLTLVRCPQGRMRHCFFQKHLDDSFDKAIKTIRIREKTGESNYAYIKDLRGLIGLVQMGTLEIHTWGSRVDDPEKPDTLVFDLDPDEGVDWQAVKNAAGEMHDFLDELGMRSFLRTSGGKGLHVVVPTTRRHSWDHAKTFCKAVAQQMAGRNPELYVANSSKAKRKNRIYIDYLRNARGATSICCYSTRSKPQAPVATPLAWTELADLESPQVYRMDNLPSRVRGLKRDPWQDYHQIRQSITRQIQRQLNME